MKVLIYGFRGWIGTQFVNLLGKKNITFLEGKSRANNINDIANELEEISPTHVISFIGRTHGKICDRVYTTIDYLEEAGKLEENVRDNLFSPIVLADLCAKKNIHYTYLGTGCIFKFDDEHPFGQEVNGFSEESLPNFFGSSYSIVKGFTDQLMSLYKDSVLNLRIRMPITGEKNGRNFITKIVNYEKVCSVPNSMTVLPELLPFVIDMMTKGITGTMNLTNPGLISHNEILEMYKEIVEPSFTWKNFSQEEQRAILAADRSNNFLDTTKLEELYPEIKNIKVSVRESLIKYKENLDLENEKKSSEINLLVTGGCGFLGSNFINHYFPKENVSKLVNIDAMYYCASEENVNEKIRLKENYVLVKGNLCDSELVTKVLKEYEITDIIHFAAQTHVQNSFEDSIKFTHDNIVGTHTLLECSRKYGKIQRFIHVSTDEVYGESLNEVNEKHKTEHSILCPTNPYAATKAGAELIAQSYAHSYKMPIIITRGNNVYGPNQYPEKLIPLFIKLLKEDKKVTIQGEGTSVRAFLHAYDTAKAFECIFEKGVVGEIYNIGCDQGMEYSVMEVTRMLIKMIKNTENYDEWIEYIEDRPYNDQRYYISNQKLKDLGWNITIKFEDGLYDLVNNKTIIKKYILKEINNLNINDYFGDWLNNIDELSNKFINAEPFEHIIIPNFLNNEYAEEIYNKFPNDYTSWFNYCNPIEVKYTCDNINELTQPIKNIFYLLSSENMIDKMSKLTNIHNLDYDEYLHGAGLHVHPRNGRLNMHLDYEKHPITGKKRRINIILYISKNWNDEWNGQTELWDKDMRECVVKSSVVFNTAIIFKTNDISWHGLPEIIKCPHHIYRKSIAYYYVSDLDENNNKLGNDGSGYRTKATFVKKPSDPYDERMEKLYKIRPFRRIEQTDMIEIWPEWKYDEQ